MSWIICMIRYHFPLILDMWALFFWKHCKILHIIFNGKHIFSFVKHHMLFGASRNAHREEGGKSWERNVSSKILKYSGKTRTRKIWKNPSLEILVTSYAVLKIQIFSFPFVRFWLLFLFFFSFSPSAQIFNLTFQVCHYIYILNKSRKRKRG